MAEWLKTSLIDIVELTEGRHTVDERVIVAVCHGGQILPQHRFTAHCVDQRDLQRRQLDIGGDKVDAGLVVQNALTGGDGLLCDDLLHQRGECGG